MALDFVDTPIAEVVRSVSLAYDTPILVDDSLDFKVTFHLAGVGVLEALSALCSAYGLELVQEESIFHVRRAKLHGTHEFSKQDTLISLSVKDKEVYEFVREFALNSGLNILASPNLEGKISGELHALPAETAFRSIMAAHGFRVWRENGCLRVGTDKVALKESDEKIRLWKDGNLYTAEIEDGSLLNVLEKIAELSDLNLAVYGDLQENVRLKMKETPLESLIEAVFKARRYSYALDSGMLYVSESGARNALASTSLYPLRHIHSERALAYLGKISSGSNFISAEVKEQNALLLAGSPAEIQMAKDLLRQIDVPAIQVTLSCIIVEFKKGKGFEIGLHSGASRKTAERDIGMRGYLDFMDKDFSVAGSFGRIGLLPDRFEMELASMEENNRAEVLARPRLTTLNGNKAELNVTNTVYYLVSQVSADGYPITDYRSFNDGISLELTPSVTQDGRITLDVSPEIKTAGRTSGDGPRDISTRNLKTVVVLENGETLCLGGLIRKSKSEVRSAVPFLGSIPLLGLLFSYTSEQEEENELAIFITPHIEKVKK
jgi:type IV pilus assembly protein PilQ